MEEITKKPEGEEIENLNQETLDVDNLTPEDLDSVSGGCGCFGVNQSQ